MEQLIEKYKKFNRLLYAAFIDYSKAFDTISHDSIWEALELFEVDYNYIKVLKNIYKKSVSRVKLEKRGDGIKIEGGVRQGDPLSPKLFILILENVFIKFNWCQKGIRINGRYLNHLRFADDVVILTETPKDLGHMIHFLNIESSKMVLEMNTSKTKIMCNSHKKSMSLNGTTVEYVDSYTHLGKQVSFSKTSSEEEVTRRANITWKNYWTLKEILKEDHSTKQLVSTEEPRRCSEFSPCRAAPSAHFSVSVSFAPYLGSVQ
ncbi:Retrovirus-related Pol polyprotein from type-1 retrotransposable element R2 [Eumeta japonica]|uniref:Retrovirus-related Pol polyprotein from type-1 retrotransposable element R2 n=1 Tax=Eumeta variegata TaxID=151549 RepID=A0A4C1UM07_EUMVA|nr:Retrovirus-related Pol polyprotein from type-1 retrotransposable element R2 [Eumeta japonica]